MLQSRSSLGNPLQGFPNWRVVSDSEIDKKLGMCLF